MTSSGSDGPSSSTRRRVVWRRLRFTVIAATAGFVVGMGRGLFESRSSYHDAVIVGLMVAVIVAPIAAIVGPRRVKWLRSGRRD